MNEEKYQENKDKALSESKKAGKNLIDFLLAALKSTFFIFALLGHYLKKFGSSMAKKIDEDKKRGNDKV